jgi:hypothetical protein
VSGWEATGLSPINVGPPDDPIFDPEEIAYTAPKPNGHYVLTMAGGE